MAISINWGTKVISVPQSYLTFVSGVKYTLDVDAFRLDLKDIEDSEEGMAFDKTHNHNTSVTVGGVTLARVVEIINGYTISFEDTGTPYQVRLEGANNNILDVANIIANVNIASTNSAGLIEVDTGGSAAIVAAAVMDDQDIETGYSLREALRVILTATGGKVSGAGTSTITFRNVTDDKDRIIATVDNDGNRSTVTLDVT